MTTLLAPAEWEREVAEWQAVDDELHTQFAMANAQAAILRVKGVADEARRWERATDTLGEIWLRWVAAFPGGEPE